MAEKRAIEIWREKLAYLREQEAIASDPSQRFQLRKQIAEVKEMIDVLGNEERLTSHSPGVAQRGSIPSQESVSGFSSFGFSLCPSVEELGGNPEQAMSWHRQIMNGTIPVRLVNNLYTPTRTFGILTRDELKDVVTWLEQKIVSPLGLRRKEKKEQNRLQATLEQARSLLNKMGLASGVNYMPLQLKGLPRHLVERAIDILSRKVYPEPFEITQTLLNSYRDHWKEVTRRTEEFMKSKGLSINYASEKQIMLDREIREIAQHLGFCL
jgi:hypothetical protein